MDSAVNYFRKKLHLDWKVLNTLLHDLLIFVEILQRFEPFKRQHHKMVKHIQTIRRLQKPTNWLNVFDHFVALVLKRLP